MRRQVLTNVQILRFIAAASVLLKHSVFIFVPTSRLLTFPWQAGVDLFFVISGFIMAWLTRGSFGDPRAAGRFLVRRALRILPPYWFFTTLMIAGVLVAPAYARKTTVDVAQVITSYLFIPWQRPSDGTFSPVLSQGWTLNYEAFFYVCFSLALLSRRGLALLAIAFVALALSGPLVPYTWSVLRFYANPILLEFLAGIALERLFHRGDRLPSWACLALIVAGLLGFAFLPASVGSVIQFTIPALLISSAFILAPEPTHVGPIRRALSAGGDASYTLYLCHPLICGVVLVLWTFAGFGHPAFGVVAGIIASLAFSILFYKAAERPVTEALQRHLHFTRPREAQMVAP